MSPNPIGPTRRPSLGVLIIPDLPLSAIVDRAVHVESRGVDSLWVADEKFYRDPFVTLGAIAERTKRLQLGTCVTDPYSRHPALIAMAMGTLNERAPGRMVIGLGAGGSGFPSMGVVRRSPAAALHEAVQIIQGLLAGEEVRVEGKVVSFLGGRMNFPTERLPIFLAGRGPRVLEAAGEYGDGVISAPFASSLTLAGVATSVAAGVSRRSDGVVPPLVARVDVAISDDRDHARDAVRYMVAMPMWSSYPNLDYLDPPGVTLPAKVHEFMATRRYEAIAWSAPHIPGEALDHFAVAGTRDDVTQRIQDIAKIADQILINPVATRDFCVEDVVTAVAEARDKAFPGTHTIDAGGDTR